MSTTSLFVELIVSGIGTVAWLILLFFSIFDYTWIPRQKLTGLLTLIPFLSLVYVLGIITDHLAHHLYKRIFHKFFCNLNKKFREQDFDQYKSYENIKSNNEYVEAVKVYVYTHAAENTMKRFEYDRSRLRIARAWGINFVFLAISTSIFAWTRLPQVAVSTKVAISTFSVFFCGLGAIFAFYTWRDLTKWEYDQLKRISNILETKNSQKGDS
ncbi:hypothetical protein HJG54_20940 [Leptolyngbya sp. NK1-12]|uniref:Uncharacterized protein n=1 Tax=Leptolyngbya sp. NK1-12 TaxID=2547451 RepID=A0AA96WI43_9CYAN|nr:hypothetical protein [Leptolyngbya sp. NK1-12]WNZ25070.1 hypothetical protein HJG54_20940 [Leptolyngbya sp. NK1-12]